jgi:hypothetical protein
MKRGCEGKNEGSKSERPVVQIVDMVVEMTIFIGYSWCQHDSFSALLFSAVTVPLLM